jgi:hypothetical protein
VHYSFHDQKHAAVADLNSEVLKQWIFGAKPPLDSFASVVSFQGHVYAMDTKGTVVVLEPRGGFTTIVASDWQEASRPSFLMDSAGELLAVRAPTFQDTVQLVFRVDLQSKALRLFA